jgi:hypothetical protein
LVRETQPALTLDAMPSNPAFAPAMRRQALFGVLGGLVVFLCLLPFRQNAHRADVFDGLPDLMLPGIVYGALVTAFLIAGEEWASGSVLRITGRAILSAIVGAVLGAGYSILGHAFYASMGGGSWEQDLLQQVLARGVGWSIFGLGAGLSAGVTSSAGRRAYQGVAGGIVGGLFAGIVFELSTRTISSPELRLLTGFLLLGACVGAATALADWLLRNAWLTFLTGSREGRDISLNKEQLVLGRSEMVDIPLFGDDTLEAEHAVLSLSPHPMIRELGYAGKLRVDGESVREANLGEGSEIALGRHRFRFHCRESALRPTLWRPPTAVLLDQLAGGPQAVPLPERNIPGPTTAPAVPWDPLVPPASTQPSPTAMFSGPNEITQAFSPAPHRTPAVSPNAPLAPGRLRLRLLGPNPRFIPLDTRPVRIGRGETNEIQLADGKVSRSHAKIEAADGGAWVLSDLESRNGTWLNGVRIVRGGLAIGDRLEIGNTVLFVEADAG